MVVVERGGMSYTLKKRKEGRTVREGECPGGEYVRGIPTDRLFLTHSSRSTLPADGPLPARCSGL